MDDLEKITERAEQARQIMLGTPDTLDATVVFAALADVLSLLDELRRVKEENDQLVGSFPYEPSLQQEVERLRKDGIMGRDTAYRRRDAAEARLREIETAASDFEREFGGIPEEDLTGVVGVTNSNVLIRKWQALRNALQPQTEKVTKMPVLPMRDGDLEPTQTEKED